MILEKRILKLIPTEDFDYILECARQYKYKKISDKEEIETLENNGYKFWEVYANGIKSGVIYISYIPKLGYTLDAYKDKRVKNKLKYSYLAGKLVVEYFLENIFPVMWAINDEENKIAITMCKKLGFKTYDTLYNGMGTFILMRRDK